MTLRARHTTLFAILLAAVIAPAASATTAGVSQRVTPCTTDDCRYATPQDLTAGSLDIAGQPGEANRITITRFADHVSIRDEANPVTPGSLCTAIDANQASCPVRFAGYSYTLAASAGDGDDTVTLLDSGPGPTGGGRSIEHETVLGGPGNDTITGGPLGDRLSGDAGTDTVSGGPGDDELLAAATSADALDGGPGSDTADFSGATAPVTVDLSSPGPDSGNTLTAIENAVGGDAGDALTGDAGPNRLDGGPGDDNLRGLDGDDQLLGRRGSDNFAAGAGNDVVDSSEAAFDFDPRDTPKGTKAEHPDCGPGSDVISSSDRVDLLPVSCETVALSSDQSVSPTRYYGISTHPRVTRNKVTFRFKCVPGYGTGRCTGRVVVKGARASYRKSLNVRQNRSASVSVKRPAGRLSVDFALDQESDAATWSIG